jgi:AcrR family transcriptional regulator
MAKESKTSAAGRALVTDKREAILRAAVKVFARKGYFNSKVADIAGEAGIADGTVYLYFKSKDEICIRCSIRQWKGLSRKVAAN